MRSLLRALCWIALGASGHAMAAMAPADIYAKVSPSVWRVTTYDRDGLPIGQGSGVVVGFEGVVTNCHVLRRGRTVSVRHDKLTLAATLFHWDVQRDVCQLKVPGLQAPPVVLGDAAQMKVGQDVYAIGHPQGLDLTMSAGLISSFRRNEAGQLMLIQTSAPISAGSSGGGLFDANGRLLGLTTIGSVAADTQNLNFAIPADWVRELPERHARLAKSAQGAASAASETVAAPAAVASGPASPPKTTPPPAPALADVGRLPFANDLSRESYRQFLALPLPRAFVISESGGWRLASGMPAGSSGPPTERAMKACEALKGGRCFLYAVDNEVVYRP